MSSDEPAPAGDTPAATQLSADQLRTALAAIGLQFDDEHLVLMAEAATRNLASYERLRGRSLDNSISPALTFSPLVAGVVPHAETAGGDPIPLPDATRPSDLADLRYASIPTLATLVRCGDVSSTELTLLALETLREVDEKLFCVVSLLEERALAAAAARDKELLAGEWRGPLHGIPWGAKDLLAVAGARTTWGAAPFADQVLDIDATVVRRLDEAGAVLVAKLTLGELAMGDRWFGGMTRNPWAPDKGSSGSSAGSAAATAAGAVPFAIGSETLGSIVSPSTVCGCSSLRPTFGRVSRFGAMALSWSMDKLGPMGRSLHDVALVFAAIHGPDGLDSTVHGLPFEVPGAVDVTGWRVGVLEEAFEQHPEHLHVVDELAGLGIELVPVKLPDYPVSEMCLVLQAEAAAAFDDLTRSGGVGALAGQQAASWPNSFRTSRLIPAVEYIQANRLRTELLRDMQVALDGLVAVVHPSFAGSTLGMGNLTGHPTAVAPDGFRDDGTPRSVSFTGQLFGESRLLAVARAWQEATGFHRQHPPL